MKKILSIGLLGVGAGVLWHFLRPTGQPPAWQRKKMRKEARRNEAARRARQVPPRPGEVHVEKEAETDLKVPLGEVIS